MLQQYAAAAYENLGPDIMKWSSQSRQPQLKSLSASQERKVRKELTSLNASEVGGKSGKNCTTEAPSALLSECSVAATAQPPLASRDQCETQRCHSLQVPLKQ